MLRAVIYRRKPAAVALRANARNAHPNTVDRKRTKLADDCATLRYIVQHRVRIIRGMSIAIEVPPAEFRARRRARQFSTSISSQSSMPQRESGLVRAPGRSHCATAKSAIFPMTALFEPHFSCTSVRTLSALDRGASLTCPANFAIADNSATLVSNTNSQLRSRRA